MNFRTGIDLKGKTGVLTLRLMLILAVALLLLPPGSHGPVPVFGILLVTLFLLSNAALLAVSEARLLDRRYDFLLVVTDTFLVAMGLFYASSGRPDFPLAFFVVLLLSAMGRDLPRVVASATVVAGFYLFLAHRTGMHAGIPAVQSLLRIPFLYITALYFGSAIMRVQTEQERATQLEMQRMDLEAFLQVTTATTSSLELRTVLRTIVQTVAQMVNAVPCSILLIKSPGHQCFVMASSDNLELEPIELDLENYPELRRAIDTRVTVVINDIGREPMMGNVRSVLEQKNIRSILVVPLMFEKEMLGMLSVRTARPHEPFSPSEIKACQVVANASANALKNALLFEEMQDEARRRKATSEVLRNIMEHFPDLIFLADLQGTLTELNRGGEALLGVTRERAVGTPAAALFMGGEVPLAMEKLRERGGSESNCQVLLKRANGDLRHGIAAVALLRDELGEPTGVVGICKDITDLKKAQRQLQNAQNLSTIERISELAQEMNSSLAGALGCVQALMASNHDSKTIRTSEQILESCVTCQKTVQKVLEFTRTHAVKASGVLAEPLASRGGT